MRLTEDASVSDAGMRQLLEYGADERFGDALAVVGVAAPDWLKERSTRGGIDPHGGERHHFAGFVERHRVVGG